MIKGHRWLIVGSILFADLWFTAHALATEITVYKDPMCGCCVKWISHLRQNGFTVSAIDVPDIQGIKSNYGVPKQLGSCHTGIVEGYVVEGHVPADVIQRLLKERPKYTGIAVPGMPMGSPGMEGPQSTHYDIIGFDAQGNTTVFTSR
jgi:hypothetical protein